MEMRDIQEEFFNNSIRPEKIIHLGTQCIDDCSWTDDAEEAFMNDFERVWEAIGISPPEEEPDELWAIAEHLLHGKKNGFLIQFATPMPRNITKGGSYSFSWGAYTTHWVYADSFEIACEKAIEWKNEYIAKEFEKAELEK